MSVPSTMRGLVVNGFGQPSEVMSIEELKVPEISDDEILVKVFYASIHMGDWKIARGDMGAMAGLMGFKPPFFMGQDYSGQIVKIGSNIENFKIGDFVYGEITLGHGSCIQYIVVTEKEKEINKIPQGINLMEAASLQCTLETVYQGLFDYASMKEGDTILILGGSSVAGMHAIQIAKNIFKSKNITVTSSREALCKSLGADNVINYKEAEWKKELQFQSFDLVFDVMGGKQSWNDCRAYNVLKPKGKFVTIAGDFEADTAITCCVVCAVGCGVINRKFWSVMGEQEYHMVNQSRSDDVEKCAQLVVDKKLKIVLDEDSPYKLEDFDKCFEKSMGRRAHGKLLIKLWDEEYPKFGDDNYNTNQSLINNEDNQINNDTNTGNIEEEEEEQKYDENE